MSEIVAQLRQRAAHAADDALLREAADHIERFESVIADPSAVHINMLRGTIAKPSLTNIVHLYGADALRAYLKQATGED